MRLILVVVMTLPENSRISTSEAYLIEDLYVTTPIKGATLIGNGPDVMGKIYDFRNIH